MFNAEKRELIITFIIAYGEKFQQDNAKCSGITTDVAREKNIF